MASKKLVQNIASRIGDYRKGEITPPDSDPVNTWISQFELAVQDSILQELGHVLERTFVTRDKVNRFLKEISSHEQLTKGNPKKFWEEATILNIQQAGSSQEEMLHIFGEVLKKKHGIDISSGPDDSQDAVYIDDVVCSGGHVSDWVFASFR